MAGCLCLQRHFSHKYRNSTLYERRRANKIWQRCKWMPVNTKMMTMTALNFIRISNFPYIYITLTKQTMPQYAHIATTNPNGSFKRRKWDRERAWAISSFCQSSKECQSHVYVLAFQKYLSLLLAHTCKHANDSFDSGTSKQSKIQWKKLRIFQSINDIIITCL